jgi:hypothetical protein
MDHLSAGADAQRADHEIRQNCHQSFSRSQVPNSASEKPSALSFRPTTSRSQTGNTFRKRLKVGGEGRKLMGAAFCSPKAGRADGIQFVRVDAAGFAVPKVEGTPVRQVRRASRASDAVLDAVAFQ